MSAAAEDDDRTGAEFSTGILPSQALRTALAEGEIRATTPVSEGQIQPASLDLRLGETAYRVQASFLPGRRNTVRDRIMAHAQYQIDLTGGAVLERNCVYIVPLMETLSLRKRLSAVGNPKSSIGRLDVFARVITDHGVEFDRIRESYKGPLYAEVSPRAFSIRVRTGSRLVQVRLRRGSPGTSDAAMRRLNRQVRLVQAPADAARTSTADSTPDLFGHVPSRQDRSTDDIDPVNRGVEFTADVHGDKNTGLIGYRAKRNAGFIDVDTWGHYDPEEFWDPVRPQAGNSVLLDPEDFYILASRETVTVPVDYAAEMLAYDTLVGEFRVHYAGFFDPGFGAPETGGVGSRAVLEVRAHEVPFLIEDGQVIGRLVYERLTARPDKLYGVQIGSSYQRQTLTLGRQFKRPA